MEKEFTTLSPVWVVTGFSYDCDGRRVLTVCPTEEDAHNAVNYYRKHYDDVEYEYECFSQETFDPTPVCYSGVFTAEVCPYENDTYVLGQVRITQSEQTLDNDIPDPKQFEFTSFTLINKISDTGSESCELRGNFLSMEKVPIKTDINVGRAAREWLIKKVNEKGVIKLVIPDFD